jgi:hypothetical protein
MRLVQRAHSRYEHTPFCTRLRLRVCDRGQNFHTASFIELPLELISMNGSVMLSEALQRNVKHEARLSNISDVFQLANEVQIKSEILRFAQNDITGRLVMCESTKSVRLSQSRIKRSV